jgi:hypothetical protein
VAHYDNQARAPTKRLGLQPASIPSMQSKLIPFIDVHWVCSVQLWNRRDLRLLIEENGTVAQHARRPKHASTEGSFIQLNHYITTLRIHL